MHSAAVESYLSIGTRLVLDVLTNPRKSHGHRTRCRRARAVLPWACLPGWRLGPLHRVLPRIWPYQRKILRNGSGKIFFEAHNFGPWWDFGKLIFAFKTWNAADADCGTAQVNRATRGRAIGTYLRTHFGTITRITFSTVLICQKISPGPK
jgi:hypothetical protein